MNLINRFKYEILATIPFIGVTIFFFKTETRNFDIFLCILLLSFFYIIIRYFRLGIFSSSLIATILVVLIFLASKVKFFITARRLHPFDLYQYFNIDNLLYAKILYPTYFWYFVLISTIMIILIFIIIKFEGFKKVSILTHIFALIVLCNIVGVKYISNYMDGNGYGQGNRFLHFDHKHTSTFTLATIRSTYELVTNTHFDYGNIVNGKYNSKDFSLNTCNLDKSQPAPNIIIVLRESAVIPSRVKGMNLPQIDDSFFQSFDGKTRILRVETHGAGSAFTIFNTLSGLSTEAFGGFKILALDLARKNIHYSLVKFFKECGYHTAALTMGIDGYVADKKFYDSLGFDFYSDINSISKFSNGDLTDRSIYAYSLDYLKKNETGKPTLLYVDTTASHFPYVDRLRAKQIVPLAENIEDKQIKEYIRRLIIAEGDASEFRKNYVNDEISKKNGLVILEFGDHHPLFTRNLPGQLGYVNEDKMLDDPLLLTWFRINSENYSLKPIPQDHPIVDASFMGDWLIRSLNIKPTGIYKLREEIMDKCKSRYWQCENGNAINELHQKMRDNGLLTFK